MSVPTRPKPRDASTVQANVVAAVSAASGDHLAAALDSVSRQVYEPHRTVVVGGGDAARRLALERGVEWQADQRTLIEGLDRTVTHVWLLHDDARPRPDALHALVTESIRVEASVAGSKLLNSDNPALLESVGGATDVFGMPYTGLEVDELDQEQYDVVRDVAFMPGASVLVRRDLLRGLGGPDPLMPPLEAGIDFSQRARSAGGRVVVVPSSEVLHEPTCGESVPRWKSRAGRIRAALKVYSVLTLTWLIPIGAVLDLLDGFVRIAIGPRLSMLDVVRSWIWNAGKLPSTISARRQLRRSRQFGDAELFRYQVRGSSVLRRLGDDLTVTVRGSSLSEGTTAISDLLQRGRQFWQQPGVIIGMVGLVLVAAASRGIIIGRLPSTGYALHLPDGAFETLSAYAGGWNPADLGNPRPLHPSVGASALVQLLLIGRAGLAELALSVGAAFLSVVGTSRLMRLLGVGSGGRLIAAVVAFSGPATLALTDTGLWPGLPALAALPFAIAAFLRPWPTAWLKRAGRVAGDTLSVAMVAVFAPLAIIVPLLATILWFLFGAGGRWTAVARATIATVLALPVLAPWIVFIDLDFLLESGRSVFWVPPGWAVAGSVAAVAIPMLAGSSRTAAIAGWGALLAGAGTAAARSSELGGGVEPGVAGLATAALGLAIVAGAAVDSLHQLDSHRVSRRLAALPGVLGGFVLAGSFFFVLADGALGFGPDRLSDPFEFTTARQADHGPDRVLMIGAVERLPGDPRMAGDISYRVFLAPEPTLLEARVHPALEGDRALADLLLGLSEAGSLRPGEQLAPFGIRWIVFDEPSPLEEAFASKLDVKPLPLTEFEAVYENLAPSPVAVEADGDPWMASGGGYVGPSSDQRVRIAVNADAGWQPEAAAFDWAVTVAAADGRASFSRDGEKATYAWIAGGLVLLLAFLALLGRRSEP